MSDATFSELRLGVETTAGTPPTGNVYPLTVISADIKRERTRKRPNVWTGSRRRRKMRVVASQGSVPIKMPLIYDQALPLYEGLMLNSRGAAITVSGSDISFDATTPGANVIERVANGLNVFPLGYMLFVRGAGEAENNGWKGPVLVSAAGSLTIPDGQIVTEAAGEAITLNVVPLLDKATPAASDDRSFSVQSKHTVLDFYNRFSKGRVDVATWDFATEDFVIEQFDLKGASPAVPRDTAVMGSGNVATWPKTSSEISTGEDMKLLYIGNAALGTRTLCFSQLQIAMRNNRIDKIALANGNGGPIDRHPGPFDAEITGEAYLDDDTIALLEAIDGEESLFAFAAVEDLQGNGMCWLIPAGSAEGEPVTGEAGNLVKFGGFKLDAHDAKTDADSDFYNAAAGCGFQAALFFSPAP
jgi:hypothetical protein